LVNLTLYYVIQRERERERKREKERERKVERW
jgi:hypothetical protein